MLLHKHALAALFCFSSVASTAQMTTSALQRSANQFGASALDSHLLDQDFAARLERQTDKKKKYLYSQFLTSKVIIKGKSRGWFTSELSQTLRGNGVHQRQR